jgi:hypothetical protein
MTLEIKYAPWIFEIGFACISHIHICLHTGYLLPASIAVMKRRLQHQMGVLDLLHHSQENLPWSCHSIKGYNSH